MLYDESTGTFVSPMIAQAELTEPNRQSQSSTFYLRSMTFPGSHVNHLMLSSFMGQIFSKEKRRQDELSAPDLDLLLHCVSPLASAAAG